jgi:hypothetical protein
MKTTTKTFVLLLFALLCMDIAIAGASALQTCQMAEISSRYTGANNAPSYCNDDTFWFVKYLFLLPVGWVITFPVGIALWNLFKPRDTLKQRLITIILLAAGVYISFAYAKWMFKDFAEAPIYEYYGSEIIALITIGVNAFIWGLNVDDEPLSQKESVKLSSEVTKLNLKKWAEDEIKSYKARLKEYSKFGKPELVKKLESCNSNTLKNLGLSYNETDKKEALLQKIMTYELNDYTKDRLLGLAYHYKADEVTMKNKKSEIISAIVKTI